MARRSVSAPSRGSNSPPRHVFFSVSRSCRRTRRTAPARRIYFALQSAYIGDEAERARGLEQARELVAAFKGATTSALAREILDTALAAAEADDCYQALKLTRRIIRHEDSVLGRETPETRAVGARIPETRAVAARVSDPRTAEARVPEARNLVPTELEPCR